MTGIPWAGHRVFLLQSGKKAAKALIFSRRVLRMVGKQALI